ncbi:hypothetical protein [Aquimarina sp. 2201CG14-23]|uniref:hypothetical protein n=1 Tax=Aquimarina mycalae TaxID=3040073 RepID=UPI0024782E0D|nr:hypothetical protein [Aquimarina sp. 2201CG14-23]MDH7447650.1 hypothetical protein [Aquimarina sp. 2201CG14-23]
MSNSNKHIFQLTMVSQNDPQCNDGTDLFGEVTSFTGGTLGASGLKAQNQVHLPIPPDPSNPKPAPSPTWFLELDGSIDKASFSVVISGPKGYTSTKITIDGSNMESWVTQNEKEKTNQIYKESSCGIFGFAQKNVTASGTYWIYTITAGVSYPVVHPPNA